MSKMFIEAIKALPDNFVDDNTLLADNSSGEPAFVLAANPQFQPIRFKDGEWREIVWTTIPEGV